MTNSSVGHLGILEFHKLRNRASSLIGQLQAVTKAFGLHSGPGKGKEPGNEVALLYCTYLPGGEYFGVKRIGMTVGNPRKLP